MVVFENGKYILRVDGMDDMIISWMDAHQLYDIIDRQCRREDILNEMQNRYEDGETAFEEFETLTDEQKEHIVDMIDSEYYNMKCNDDSWVYMVQSAVDYVVHNELGDEYRKLKNGLYKFNNCEGDV